MGFTQTINCQIDREMNVFAVFPHMHQLGKHMVVETGAELAAMNETYRIDPWVFGDQPFDEVEFTLPAGTHVRTTCTWDNDTNMDVTFGESTFNEMCFSVLFYYPFSDLVFCIDP
jgi:hypothetical protein